MKILIIGGGLGGLSAALCFARQRNPPCSSSSSQQQQQESTRTPTHQVLLLEARPQFLPQGSGLNVRPPATRILHTWGLRSGLADISHDTPTVVLRDLATGDVATRNVAADAGDGEGERERGKGGTAEQQQQQQQQHVEDWGTQRRELIALLYESAREAGAEIRFGSNVVAVSDDDDDDGGDGTRKAATAIVESATDGTRETVRADLILAADGIRSRIRPLILGDLVMKDDGDGGGGSASAIEPVISDLTLYGTMLDGDVLAPPPSSLPPSQQQKTEEDDDEEKQKQRRLPPDLAARLTRDYNINVYMGRRAFVVSKWNAKLRSHGCLFGVKGATDQAGLWDEKGDLEFVRRVFRDGNSSGSSGGGGGGGEGGGGEGGGGEGGGGEGAGGEGRVATCPELLAILDRVETCDRWRLAEMPDLPRWTSKGGRIVLLGDSAHAMHPNAAHGYSSIVEDIGVLEYLISHFTASTITTDPTNSSSNNGKKHVIPFITSTWQAIRKPRAERIKAWAHANSDLFIAPEKGRNKRGKAPAQQYSQPEKARIKSLRDTVPDMNAPFHSSAFLKWTLAYDAVGEAKKYVKQMQDSPVAAKL